MLELFDLNQSSPGANGAKSRAAFALNPQIFN